MTMVTGYSAQIRVESIASTRFPREVYVPLLISFHKHDLLRVFRRGCLGRKVDLELTEKSRTKYLSL